MKKILILLSLILASAGAQTPSPTPTPTFSRFPIWAADLPGGKFSVDVTQIASVSTHEFTVGAALHVVEATVAMQGSVVARFYYVEPLQIVKTPGGVGQSALEAAQEKLKEAVQAAGSQEVVDSVWEKVEKTYPVATHAHTVEYRLASEAEVMSLYTSVEKAWRLRQSGAFKISPKTSG
jgi:hypothetical protein